MTIVLTITLPLFVLILAGYVMAWRGVIDGPGIKGLTSFVYYIALPLMLFHLFANAPVREAFDGRYVLIYLAIGVSLYFTGFAAARWLFGCSWQEQAVHGFGTSFGNTVFIALPVATGLFGKAANLPILLAISVENGLLLPLAIALLEFGRAREGALLQALTAALAAILKSPVVMPVILGAAVAVSGLKLPVLADGIIELVRGATVPCALFALGATLAGLPLSERFRETAFMVVMKLVAFPVLVYIAMTVFLPDLDPVWRACAAIAAAGPMGANVYLIAMRYEAYVARASTGILISTTLSVVTITALALILGP